jgi:CrcB protein
MLKSILIVGAGSFLGGALRFLISTLMKSACTSSFPWGTLMVNLLGCLLIGVIYGLFAHHSNVSHAMCLLLTTGFCGGFTTFSTFANEGVQMLQSGNIGGFAAYASQSLALGILLVILGYIIAR